MPGRPDVIVLGAGVSGLTSALALATADLGVEVWTQDLPLESTSCAAAAMWAPYLVDDARVVGWSRATYRWLLGRTEEQGVRQVAGREVSRSALEAPLWMRGLPDYRGCHDAEVPSPYAVGWRYRAPMIDMPAHLRALVDDLAKHGVPVRRRAVRSFTEPLSAAPVVVNCTGVAARALVPDDAVSPTRGQIVVVENPGIEEFFTEHDESETPVYFMPHGDRLVLGGSAEPGRTDLVPDRRVADAIRSRCAAIDPRVGRARVLEHRVGLRPSRASVRLEREPLDAGHVVHNYGHGGAGITLSWGCASDVASLAGEVLR
ncbi:FAD-dependent oxidoreductase [Rhizomonospora bruguierae]|uniref:FAD-dependent oxidoreductase n=1 Tax=Rhizomonospora bruguierae TaxID=1581705 RepID=UPI0020BEAEA0|nr:FAD-dependent oxidoreductase [Micromonospora sp. NBRC 107566]